MLGFLAESVRAFMMRYAYIIIDPCLNMRTAGVAPGSATAPDSCADPAAASVAPVAGFNVAGMARTIMPLNARRFLLRSGTSINWLADPTRPELASRIAART